ncbi:MAG: hypothetical protein HC767_01080 [Akkermansiaceae bacterium]|nr:hypothetical protein [Akkermansiaceae bacterium]
MAMSGCLRERLLNCKPGCYVQEQRQKPSVVKKSRLSTCFLSSSELCCPLVCDYAGNLYSKASIVEYLLWKKNKLDDSEETSHKCVLSRAFSCCASTTAFLGWQ